jgi:putative nucleotidyltransferase with HDIG domain
MEYQAALDLLTRYGISGARLEHSIGVSRFAYDLAQKIAAKHPDLPVDPEKVRIAALLHDIGRSQPGDHELNSMRILRKEGLPHIAEIAIHGTIYEIARLRGVDDPALLPATLENKIVAYADARFRLSVVTLDQRFADVRERRKDDPDKLASIDIAIDRFKSMERELMGLLE